MHAPVGEAPPLPHPPVAPSIWCRPSKFETIAPASRPPNRKYNVPTEITSSREESKEADANDKATFKVYTDGSGQDGMAGAAAVLYKGHALVGSLCYHLGSLEQHTTYEAELIGILLGLWLIRREPDADSASLKVDSQAAIQALNVHKPRLGGHILDEIQELSDSLHVRSLSDLQLKISWISGHDGVAGNEKVDEEAKVAAKGDSSPWQELPTLLQSGPLPFGATAVKQHFWAELTKNWREIWASSPRHQHAAKIDPRLPAASFLKLTREVSKLQASTIFQLRSKHVPLCQYLHRISKADSPLCEMCRHEEETVHHFLFDCPAHDHARFKLGRKLGRLSKSIRCVLGSCKALEPLLLYVHETGRLRGHQEPMQCGSIHPR